MSTKFTMEHKFSKPVENVWKMYSDRTFFEKKYAELGYTNVQITDYSSSAKGFSITARYDAANDAPMPDFAKKFMSSTVSVTQTDNWDAASKTGNIKIDIKGVPAKVTAEMKLENVGKGSVNKMNWVISVGIPLIGGKLESVLAEDVKTKSPKDSAASEKLLKNY